MKISLAIGATILSSLGASQCEPPAKPTTCVVYAAKDTTARIDVSPPCQLDLIGTWAPGECANYGGTWTLPDTCSGVDY